MPANILLTKSQVADAPMADLVATYNSLSPKPVKRFESRATAERRVAALLPERAAAPAAPENPYKPGTMAHRLWFATRESQPITPKPKKPARDPNAPRTRRPRIDAVQLNEAPGHTKLQANSLRSKVVEWLKTQPNWNATIAHMESKQGLKMPCRGHVQKLLEGGHLSVVQMAGE